MNRLKQHPILYSLLLSAIISIILNINSIVYKYKIPNEMEVGEIFSTHYLILCLFPFNCIIIAAKTIRYMVLEWNEKKDNKTKLF